MKILLASVVCALVAIVSTLPAGNQVKEKKFETKFNEFD